MAMQPDRPIEQAADPHALRLPEIEEGLSKLWTEAPGGTPVAGAPTATRVCTLNLVVVVSDVLGQEAALEATEIASQTHPVRVVILLAEPAAGEAKTEGSVSGYCRMIKAGDIQICCERIVLRAQGDAVEELPAAAASLLVADLPVVMWWTGRPQFLGSVFGRLMAISDFLVVDSREFVDPATDLAQMAASIGGHKQVGAGDLNWLRLAPWQEQVAELFDDAAFLPYLAQVSSLSIEYAAGAEPNPSQAVLFAGWFSSRMKWSPAQRRAGATRREFEAAVNTAEGRAVSVRMSPVQCGYAAAGDLVTVGIEAGGLEAEFRLSGVEGHPRIETTAQAPEAPPLNRKYEFSTPSPGELIAALIDSMGAGTIYKESLAAGLDLIVHQPGDVR